MEKQRILNKLLEILTKFLKIDIDFGNDYDKDRMIFRGLCDQSLQLDGIGDEFYKLQNKLLLIEQTEKGIVNVNDFDFHDNLTIWQGDITRLNSDVIVNAANNQFLGCFIPCHNCIDNIIMSASGFQMRNELLELKSRIGYDCEKVKVTKGYNLPCKYVFHVAGPQIFETVLEKDKQELANCYENCLDKMKEMKLKSIAFCCISTGVYSFPNDIACEIAVETVQNWLQKNKYDIKVIFNVFKDIDRVLYERKLCKKN